jgi:hypothetical protein
MSRAKKRCVNNSLNRLNPWWRMWFNHVSVTPWIQGHRVEKGFLTVADCLKLPSDIPALCFEKSDTIVPESIRDLHDFAIIHPGQWLNSREEILLIRASEIMRAHQPGKVFAAAREIMRAPVPDQAG